VGWDSRRRGGAGVGQSPKKVHSIKQKMFLIVKTMTIHSKDGTENL
jgi:hypothetical protein